MYLIGYYGHLLVSIILFDYSTDENGRTVSLGEGVEREVLQIVFQMFCLDSSQWFILHADGHSTLATSHTYSTSRHVSAARKRSMTILGAITSLCLMRGLSATPIDPVVLQFFIHDCNLNSIHPGILGEWHPHIRQTVSEWIEAGPEGDVMPFQSHFASYHDLQVSLMKSRILSEIVLMDIFSLGCTSAPTRSRFT